MNNETTYFLKVIDPDEDGVVQAIVLLDYNPDNPKDKKRYHTQVRNFAKGLFPPDVVLNQTFELTTIIEPLKMSITLVPATNIDHLFEKPDYFEDLEISSFFNEK